MPFVLSIEQSNTSLQLHFFFSTLYLTICISTLICFNNSSADDYFTSAYRHVLLSILKVVLYLNLFIITASSIPPWHWWYNCFCQLILDVGKYVCNPTPNASWCARIHCRTCIINPINQCYVDICVVATSLSPDFTRRGGWCKLLFAINLTDVCLGTAFMLTSATVQRQWLTTIVPQVVDISFGGHRGVYIE